MNCGRQNGGGGRRFCGLTCQYNGVQLSFNGWQSTAKSFELTADTVNGNAAFNQHRITALEFRSPILTELSGRMCRTNGGAALTSDRTLRRLSCYWMAAAQRCRFGPWAPQEGRGGRRSHSRPAARVGGAFTARCCQFFRNRWLEFFWIMTAGEISCLTILTIYFWDVYGNSKKKLIYGSGVARSAESPSFTCSHDLFDDYRFITGVSALHRVGAWPNRWNAALPDRSQFLRNATTHKY